MIEMFVIGLIAILIIVSITLLVRSRMIMKTDELGGRSLMAVAFVLFMIAAVVLAVAIFLWYLI